MSRGGCFARAAVAGNSMYTLPLAYSICAEPWIIAANYRPPRQFIAKDGLQTHLSPSLASPLLFYVVLPAYLAEDIYYVVLATRVIFLRPQHGPSASSHEPSRMLASVLRRSAAGCYPVLRRRRELPSNVSGATCYRQ